MPSKMKGSHVFGTTSMPMKKPQKRKKSSITSFMSMDKIYNLMGSIPQTATKSCGNVCDDSQPTQANVTSVSMAVVVGGGLEQPATSGAFAVASSDMTHVVSAPDYLGRSLVFSAFQLLSGFPMDDITSSDDGSQQRSSGISPSPPPYPPSNSLAAEEKTEDTTTAQPMGLKRTTTARLPSPDSALDFPGLAIILPARLYGDDKEPIEARVPFATSEEKSQVHARRVFLHRSVTADTSVRGIRDPLLPGTAIHRLGGSRMFGSLFPPYFAPRPTVLSSDAVADLAITIEDVQDISTGPDDDPSAATAGSSVLKTEPIVEVNYNPLRADIQQIDNEVPCCFDREPLFTINDNFSGDKDKIIREPIAASQASSTIFPAFENVVDTTVTADATDVKVNPTEAEPYGSSAALGWLLADNHFGSITELSASDVAMQSLPADTDYSSLDTSVQFNSAREAPYSHRKPTLPIEEKAIDSKPCSQLLAIPSALGFAIEQSMYEHAASHKAPYTDTTTHEASANNSWLLSDNDFGIITELSVSDIAEASQKKVMTFSEGISTLATPVLQSLAGVKFSLTANCKLDNPKVRRTSAWTTSTSLHHHSPGYLTAASTVTTSTLDFQMSNTFLGSTSFTDLLAYLPYADIITKPILARTFTLCVAAEHADRLLFSPSIAATGVTLVTESDTDNVMAFEIQRRAKLGCVSLFEFLRRVKWDGEVVGVELVWEVWQKKAVGEQQREERGWKFQ